MANNVTVNFTQNVATTDPLGAGFVCSEFLNNGGIVAIVSDNTWNAALAALGVGHIRFSLAWYNGNPSYGAGGSPGQQGSGGSAASGLLNAVKNMGAIPLVSFNGNTADNNFQPADGGSLVHFFNDNGGQHGGRIQYWSIGNEPEFSGGTGIYQSGSGQGSASATLAAMHTADPTINIGIPTAGHWDAPLLQWSAGVANIGTMSYHAYDGANTDDSTGSAYPTATSEAVRKRPLSLLKRFLLAQVIASRPSFVVLSLLKERQKYMSLVESAHVCDAYPSRRSWNTTRGNGIAPGADIRRSPQIGSTPSRRPYGQR